MDEETFNSDVRKFLRRVGVTGQQQIETAVRAALESGRLAGRGSVNARMVLTIDELGLRHEVDAELTLPGPPRAEPM